MRKWFAGIMLGLSIMLTAWATPALAAGADVMTAATPLFTGTFEGVVYGDFDSEAPLTLTLDQRGRVVEGTAVIGSGLEVNAGGFCGTAVVPAGSATATGATNTRQPRLLSANIPLDVGSFNITARVSGDLADDDETLDVVVKIDTPFLCGRDPVIEGTLSRVS